MRFKRIYLTSEEQLEGLQLSDRRTLQQFLLQRLQSRFGTSLHYLRTNSRISVVSCNVIEIKTGSEDFFMLPQLAA